MPLVVAMAVGESFEEAPEEGASSMEHICTIQKIGISSVLKHDIEYSAVEGVPVPDQVVEHTIRIVRFDGQFAEAYVARHR